MSIILALAKKDLRLLSRDKASMFWILAFPLMFALFFGAIFGDSGGGGRSTLKLAVVDEDGTALSQAFATKLESNDAVELRTLPEDVAYDHVSAREAVQKGRLTAYVRIPEGYGTNPYAMFGGGNGETAAIEVGVDPSRSAEGGFLQGVLMEASFGALQARFSDPDALHGDLKDARDDLAANTNMSGGKKLVMRTLLGALDGVVDDFDLGSLGGAAADGGGGMGAAITMVDVSRSQENEPRSAFDVTFPQALVWGLMSIAMAFAIMLVRERTSGTLLRLRMAPIGRIELLAGKALACFAGCMFTMTAIEVFGYAALGVRFDSIPLMLLAMSATSVCFTGIMMTISVMGKTEPAVAGASWGLMMPFAMVGGGMIPLMAMPDWLVKLSVVSPFKWAITAVEGAAWRGYDLSDMLMPCGVLVAIGLATFAFGVFVFQRIHD